MCGIAGIIDFKRRPLAPEPLEAMLAALAHRGPDDQGVHRQGHVSLGMRRLKIIALENGDQPCFSDDGRFVLVFNGEIYNYRELRRTLLDQGFRFTTDSDAEVIANLYQRDGEAFHEQLDGMFALALYDRQEDMLLLARDNAGKKPLLYSFCDGMLVFASEMNSLLQSPTVPREVDFGALDYFLRYRVVPGDRAILEQVHKVPSGSSVRFTRAGASLCRHWRVNYQPAGMEERSAAQWLDELDDALNAAVAKRLLAEVPIGTMLSGGLDSSLVTAIAQRHSKVPLNTFAVGFHEARYDERSHARRLAADLGTRHHEWVIEPAEALAAAHRLIAHFGEPFAFPSAIASYFMFRMAKQDVRVVLGGDGADELFGGYARYSLAASFPELTETTHLPRKVDLQGFQWNGAHFPDFYSALLTDGLGSEQRQSLYSPAMVDRLTKEGATAREGARRAELNPGKTQLSIAMEYDFNHWMPESQLAKVDIASMANSLEVRAPFLDKQVIRLGSRLPENLKIRQGQEKYLLHCLGKRYLPDYILRRKKQELAVPLEQWICSSLSRTIVSTITSDRALARGYFDADRLIRFAHHASEKDSYALWTLYMLELWHQQFIDR